MKLSLREKISCLYPWPLWWLTASEEEAYPEAVALITDFVVEGHATPVCG